MTTLQTHLKATTLRLTVSPATSKPKEDCEHEHAEETHEPYCDTELVEDKMNTKSEELNSAGMEGREK